MAVFSRIICFKIESLGRVVQSIVSLTGSLRGQLVKRFITLLPNTLIFFVEKMREAFAVQRLFVFFQQKILVYIRNERSFCIAKASHIFSTKSIGVFQILMFEILTKR